MGTDNLRELAAFAVEEAPPRLPSQTHMGSGAQALDVHSIGDADTSAAKGYKRVGPDWVESRGPSPVRCCKASRATSENDRRTHYYLASVETYVGTLRICCAYFGVTTTYQDFVHLSMLYSCLSRNFLLMLSVPGRCFRSRNQSL